MPIRPVAKNTASSVSMSASPGTRASGSAEAQANQQVVEERIVEIVADSGEGAQKAGQIFGTISAKMGNGVWTVEIIPAEIKPPSRSRAGASGIRIRFGTKEMTNMGDEADLVVALNEQVLFGRMEQRAYHKGTVLLLESKWRDDPDPKVRQAYADALEQFQHNGYTVHEMPMEQACMEHTSNPRLGKNMFVLGMLCWIYQRDATLAEQEIQAIFGRKGEKVVAMNQALLRAGVAFAREQLEEDPYYIPPMEVDASRMVLNGNQALGLGVMAAGIEVVSMYPITPATSASHYLAGVYKKVGGVVHQAEDEIAAMGFAIGCSYAGKTACTITSGPGLALKTELLGLAVMAEVPLVIIDVQRGSPSTGLPTKVEQGDLLAALYGEPGDAPKPVLAAATIEDCLELTVTARKIAEAFRTPVILLTDANLASGVQPIPRPQVTEDWLAPPIDQSPWQDGVCPYDWDAETGLSPRPIPGQRGGEYVLTGLTHTRHSKVAYDSHSHQLGCEMRSRKLAALRSTLTPPKIHGDEQGDLLVVGWGSTLGAIEEAVNRARAEGQRVSSVHLRFLSPMEPGLKEIFSGFKRVMTVEISYSDPPEGLTMGGGTQPGRPSQLALLLREQVGGEIDYWSITPGHPLSPRQIYDVLMGRLADLDVV